MTLGKFWIGATAAAALVLMADAPTPAVQRVIAAERAFAADGVANGIRDSFPRHAAPDGIVFGRGGLAIAREVFSRAPTQPAGQVLDWWPVFAGASTSGDLGFTTGPYSLGGTVRGYYFTVWRRQPDGEWQWIFDGGGEASADGAPAKGSAVSLLSPAENRARSARAAMSQVTRAEAALAAATHDGLLLAFGQRLAPDARLYIEGQPPVTRRSDALAALAHLPSGLEFGPVAGGAASQGGDLVWVYGDARWRTPQGPVQGRYVRVWQYRDGWRIVFAEIVPA